MAHLIFELQDHRLHSLHHTVAGTRHTTIRHIMGVTIGTIMYLFLSFVKLTVTNFTRFVTFVPTKHAIAHSTF